MGPAQFVTQCVTLWKCLIKKPHITQIRGIEAFTKLRRKCFRQNWQQPFSISCTLCSSLLEFNDMPSNLPAGMYLKRINGAQHFTACLLDQLTEFVDQWRKLWIVLG